MTRPRTLRSEVLELGSKIQSQVQSEVGKNQREYFLREQMKAIQKELGEGDDQTKDVEIGSARAGIEDPVAGAIGGRQEPTRVLSARADEGHSERARRRR